MHHFIWAFTVFQFTCLGVSGLPVYNELMARESNDGHAVLISYRPFGQLSQGSLYN